MFHHPGPLSLLRGEADEEEIEMAGAITARYSKARVLERVEIECKKAKEDTARSFSVSPIYG